MKVHSECGAVTIQEHQQLLLRDALVAGCCSDVIRMRLLEPSDADATRVNCVSVANAIELSSDYSRSFHSGETPDSTSVAETPGGLCATGRSA